MKDSRVNNRRSETSS